jgi:protein-tyrosine-phosphatase
MPSVLFVCTANICRSPVAAALFADWVSRQGSGDEWQVSSAGTWTEHGLLASTYSREVVGELGLDLSAHRSQPVDEALVEGSDLIVCMTRGQAEALKAEFPAHRERIVLLSGLSGVGYDVPDPYGGPRSGYEAMLRELQDLIERGGRRIVALSKKAGKRRPLP